MYGVLANASLARVPAGALPLLGRLRAYASVEVCGQAGHVWVRWNEGGYEVLQTLLPVEDAEFFERADNAGQALWRRCGHSLPAFEVPDHGFHPLAGVLVPGPQQTFTDIEETTPRVVLALKRSGQARPATALMCTRTSLAQWAEMAASRDITVLKAATSENSVLLTGQPLPAIEGERYWGERLLCPLGWAPDPALPESALLEAAGVADGEIALLRGNELEIIPRDQLVPLTRASARLGAT